MEVVESDVVNYLKKQGFFDEIRKEVAQELYNAKEDDKLKSRVLSLLQSPSTPPPKENLVNNTAAQRRYFRELTQYIEQK